MATKFGRRVTGQSQEAFDADQKAEASGKHNFGVRVTGALPGAQGALASEKANSELGPRVAATAKPKSEDIWLPVEELERNLNQNPTFFDDYHEAEMSRPGGPRKDALMVLRTVELGPSGGGRTEVIAEIDRHLTGSAQPGAAAAREAAFDAEEERREQDQKNRERNLKLRDAATHMIRVPVTSEALLEQASKSQQETESILGVHSRPAASRVVGGGSPSSARGRTAGRTSANTGMASSTAVANTGLENPDLSAPTGLTSEGEGEDSATTATKKAASKRASAKKGSRRKASAKKSS
jgi:hypothetical protein